jgi:hypothetical protein
MSRPDGESKYAQKVRRGDRMYGPCRVGVYNQTYMESIFREIEEVKYWVGRIRMKRGYGGEQAVTLEDIRTEKDRTKAAP